MLRKDAFWIMTSAGISFAANAQTQPSFQSGFCGVIACMQCSRMHSQHPAQGQTLSWGTCTCRISVREKPACTASQDKRFPYWHLESLFAFMISISGFKNCVKAVEHKKVKNRLPAKITKIFTSKWREDEVLILPGPIWMAERKIWILVKQCVTFFVENVQVYQL